MVALKKLFNTEKDHRQAALDSTHSHSATEVPSRSTPNSGLSRQPNAERQFEIFWREYEESQSELEKPSHVSDSDSTRISGHVDLLEALFSSHRYHLRTRMLSPISPYNEDVAERNMSQFPREMARANTMSLSHPSMYQEDVADRNIAVGRSSSPLSARLSGRSSQATASRSDWERRPVAEGSRCRSRGLSPEKKEESTKPVPKSQADLHSVFASQDEDSMMPVMRTVQSCPVLRTHRSVPDLSATEDTNIPQERTGLHSIEYLSVPPGYKQGDALSNTPLPDSPTLPLVLMHDHDPNKNGDKKLISREPTPSNCDSEMSSSSCSRALCRRNAKKNVQDLSIDTETATLGGQRTKIAHRAIQPPTPSDSEKQNASIAEVMSSPLPPSSPFSPFPGPRALDPTYSFEEMMNAFRRACIPRETTTNSQPTCESLQDAIVREINSHEAFQRVSVPDNHPPLSPSASLQDMPFDQDSKTAKRTGLTSGKNLLAKENQIARFINRGSQKKRARDPKLSRSGSVSTDTSSTGYGPVSQRRHTDAPVPSRDLLNSIKPMQQASFGESTRQTSHTRGTVQQSHHQRSSISTDQMEISGSSFGNQGIPKTPAGSFRGISGPSDMQGSVYYMRAHSEGLSGDDRDGYSAQDDEDEVVELPSVDFPRLQSQSINEYNVAYIMNSATSDDAYRLMNWPNSRREQTVHQEQWPLIS